jgi:hypothetical protein
MHGCIKTFIHVYILFTSAPFLEVGECAFFVVFTSGSSISSQYQKQHGSCSFNFLRSTTILSPISYHLCMSLLAIMLYSTTRSSVLILLICSLVDAYVRLPFAATLPSQLRSAVISSDTAYTSSDVPMDIHWDWQQVASQALKTTIVPSFSGPRSQWYDVTVSGMSFTPILVCSTHLIVFS